MNKKIQELAIKLQQLPNLSKRTSEKMAISLIENKIFYIEILKNVVNDIDSFAIDSLTHEIILTKDNFEKDYSTLFVFINNQEAFNILPKIGGDSANFIIGFTKGKDYLNSQKITELVNRFHQYLITFSPQEIILLLSPSPEAELIYRLFRQKIAEEQLKDIKVTKLIPGVPFNSSIEYIDEITLKKALENRG
ncbi:MAG: hypothetical protein GQ557_01745 [Mycoplasmataceae bacterium]|nr:hypothetical protein [Mycoplasmataceae bacterium]